jgi:hypothetical protein
LPSASAKPGSRTTLVIFDPTLKSFDGHSHNYDFAVAEQARQRFDDVIILADRSFEQRGEAGASVRSISEPVSLRLLRGLVRRLFPRTDSGALPNAPGRRIVLPFQQLWKLLRARGFAASLARTLHAIGSQTLDEIHVLIQHADLYEIAGVDAFRLRYGRSSGPRIIFHLLMRHDAQITRAGQESVPAFRARLLRLAQSQCPQVRFHTDSAAVAESFHALTGRAGLWTIVPIPVSRRVAAASRDHGQHSAGVVRLAVMGSSRIERGFGTLPALVPGIPATLSGAAVRLAVQINRNAADPAVQRVIRWLEAYRALAPASGVVVELLDGPATEDVYGAWFAAADILLAPYTSSKYVCSTSGVFVEALYLGIPAVVMRGTWSAGVVEQAAQRGLRIGEIAESIDAIPAHAGKLWESLPRYRNDLRSYLETWKALHAASVAQLLLAAAAQ